MECRRWTNEEDNYLKEKFKELSIKEIVQKLNRTENAISLRLGHLKLYLEKWTEQELSFLKSNFNSCSHRQLADKLNKTLSAIQHKCVRIGLYKPKDKINNSYFDNWSSNMAYCLGFITADGSVYNKNYSYRLSIEINSKDSEVLEFFQKEICPERKISYRLRTGGFTKNISSFSCFRISSKQMYQSLNELGIFPNKTGKETLPNIPDKYKPDYLRGLFDGDGSVAIWNKHRRFNIVSSCEKFINDVRSELGFNYGTISTKIRKGFKPIHYWEVQNRQKITQLSNYMYYSGHGFALDRKRVKMLSIAKEYMEKYLWKV